MIITKGSAAVRGMWVSLASAQALFPDHESLRVFLSDDLHTRFPQALQDFHTSDTRERSLVQFQFGPNFKSTEDAKRKFPGPPRMELPTREQWRSAEEQEEEREMRSPWDEHWLCHPYFATMPPNTEPPAVINVVPETPLSPTEEEMFHTLCAAPEWEPVASPAAAPPPSSPPPQPPTSLPCPHQTEMPTVEVVACRERPLRRSRRAISRTSSSRPRTRSAAKISKSVHC